MLNSFARTERLLGNEAMIKLQKSRVAVFGIGGVGSFAAEALARSGIGTIALIDNDVVTPSNINRQLVATTKTVGQKKVEVMKARIMDINPDANVKEYQIFYSPENAHELDLTEYNYIIDAIDTVSSKLLLIEKAKSAKVPIISSMGAGNKLEPTMFEVTDIHKTSMCPLAKVMRYELRRRGIKDVKVVFSKEPPLVTMDVSEGVNVDNGKRTPGSISFVPPVAGMILAGEVIKDLAFI